MGYEDNGGALPLPGDLVPVQDVAAHLYQTRGLGWSGALQEIGADADLRLFSASPTAGRQEVTPNGEYWGQQQAGRRIISPGLNGGSRGNPAPAKQFFGRGPRGLLAFMAANPGNTTYWSSVMMLRADAARRFGYGEVPSMPAQATSASVLTLVATEAPGKKTRDDDLKTIQPEGYTWPLRDGETFTDAHKEAAFEMRHKSKVTRNLPRIVGCSRQAIDKHIGGATVLKTNQWGEVQWRPSKELLERCGIAPTGLQSTAAALVRKSRKSE